MRFKLTLNRSRKQRMLPMDHQYFAGAWIYHVIGRADSDFATFLHNEGYKDGNKQFKFFNYSPLIFGKATTWKEKALFALMSPEGADHLVLLT